MCEVCHVLLFLSLKASFRVEFDAPKKKMVIHFRERKKVSFFFAGGVVSIRRVAEGGGLWVAVKGGDKEEKRGKKSKIFAPLSCNTSSIKGNVEQFPSFFDKLLE